MALTGEIARTDDELRRAYDGDCWHGPPLRAVLKGVTAKAAAAKYEPLVHSIWGLVRHITAWVDVAARRITEWRAILEPDEGAFPAVTDTSAAAWAAALEDLDRRHRTLLGVLAGLDPKLLDEIVPGKDYPVAVMLHGTVQHYGYHAGQIALLKKLVAG